MSTAQAFLTLIGGIVVALGGYLTARAGNRSSPYDALAARVVALESADSEKAVLIADLRHRLDRVEGEHAIMRDALIVQHEWQEAGATPPPPVIHPKALALLREGSENDA